MNVLVIKERDLEGAHVRYVIEREKLIRRHTLYWGEQQLGYVELAQKK